MVASEVSGITFTVHPVTKDKNQMVIEAGFGLGEAIVGGMITPDTYIVDKSKCKMQNAKLPASLSLQRGEQSKKQNFILDKNVSEQAMKICFVDGKNKEVKLPGRKGSGQKISDKKIAELAELCLKIEKHYKKPQDIEWAMEKKKFYIVQSRPITTL
jgi:pyruvate,water dikinase